MDRSTPPRQVRAPGVAVSLALLALLLAVNAAAIGGILAARDGARREALNELELQTEVHARSLEVALAGLRGDLLLLSQSPPLTAILPAAARDDPMARRWRRLDVEGGLLLFLAAHPPVERLVVCGADRRPAVVAGRSAGAPVVLPAAAAAESAVADGAGRLFGRWPLGAAGGEAGSLEATVAPAAVLAAAAPGLDRRLSLVREGEAPPPAAGAEYVARVAVHDAGWKPPLAATLVRRESGSQLVRSVEALAARFRTTVILNVAVIGLTVALGWLAFRQVRRAERLAAERAQQIRLRDLEHQVMHSERLASVGRLAAGMAHEINNPLEGMANYLSLLDDELAGGDVAAARALARRVREGLDRAAGILRRVLAASAAGSERRQRLDLREVVAEAVAFLDGGRSFSRATVHLHRAAAPVPVTGSPVALGQLVLNLLLNACQAQPDGGEVEIEIGGEGRWARVAVADRGPGLPVGSADRLFEPFFSTRGSTGLGLAICHRIATDHGGSIHAEDRPGGGAVFTVRLPLAAAAEPSLAAAGEPAA